MISVPDARNNCFNTLNYVFLINKSKPVQLSLEPSDFGFFSHLQSSAYFYRHFTRHLEKESIKLGEVKICIKISKPTYLQAELSRIDFWRIVNIMQSLLKPQHRRKKVEKTSENLQFLINFLKMMPPKKRDEPLYSQDQSNGTFDCFVGNAR